MTENPAPSFNARRARRAGVKVIDLSVEDWVELIQEYNHCCAFCGKYTKKLTKDHLTPLCKGGAHSKSNIVPACAACNSRKGAMTLERFVQVAVDLDGPLIRKTRNMPSMDDKVLNEIIGLRGDVAKLSEELHSTREAQLEQNAKFATKDEVENIWKAVAPLQRDAVTRTDFQLLQVAVNDVKVTIENRLGTVASRTDVMPRGETEARISALSASLAGLSAQIQNTAVQLQASTTRASDHLWDMAKQLVSPAFIGFTVLALYYTGHLH